MTCKTHPDAPHGFLRDASHSEDRYVCECEFWEPPEAEKQEREWVGLTDDEIQHLQDTYDIADYDYARAIEAKLKEKNHG